MQVWDLRLAIDQRTDLALPAGYTTALVGSKGGACVNGSEPVTAAEVGLFDRAGTSIAVDCAQGAMASGCAARRSMKTHRRSGPFVMNSTQEIRQAIADYQSGKMGHLS